MMIPRISLPAAPRFGRLTSQQYADYQKAQMSSIYTQEADLAFVQSWKKRAEKAGTDLTTYMTCDEVKTEDIIRVLDALSEEVVRTGGKNSVLEDAANIGAGLYFKLVQKPGLTDMEKRNIRRMLKDATYFVAPDEIWDVVKNNGNNRETTEFVYASKPRFGQLSNWQHLRYSELQDRFRSIPAAEPNPAVRRLADRMTFEQLIECLNNVARIRNAQTDPVERKANTKTIALHEAAFIEKLRMAPKLTPDRIVDLDSFIEHRYGPELEGHASTLLQVSLTSSKLMLLVEQLKNATNYKPSNTVWKALEDAFNETQG